jgi:hypothetical protein
MNKFNEMLTAELEKLLTEYSENKRNGVLMLTGVELRELTDELRTR